jgi:hypothetical protein
MSTAAQRWLRAGHLADALQAPANLMVTNIKNNQSE